LKNRRGLAQECRHRTHAETLSEKEKKTRRYNNVSAQHNNDEPQWNSVLNTKNDIRRCKHDFISERIKICAKDRLRSHSSCEEAVQQVTDSLKDKEKKGQVKALVDNGDDKEKGKKQPEEGEDIGKVHSVYRFLNAVYLS
jgi:hypothetical protein